MDRYVIYDKERLVKNLIFWLLLVELVKIRFYKEEIWVVEKKDWFFYYWKILFLFVYLNRCYIYLKSNLIVIIGFF